MKGPEGSLGPPPPWTDDGDPLALDFGYTREELHGLLVGMADRLVRNLEARARHLVADPVSAIEVEIRWQMAEAALVGRYDEVQQLHELLLQAQSVASQFQSSSTST